jgi:hypothetical protein
VLEQPNLGRLIASHLSDTVHAPLTRTMLSLLARLDEDAGPARRQPGRERANGRGAV